MSYFSIPLFLSQSQIDYTCIHCFVGVQSKIPF